MYDKEYDYDRLRNDLINYFGSATSIEPFAFGDVLRIQRASDYELIQIAIDQNFDLSDYEVYVRRR